MGISEKSTHTMTHQLGSLCATSGNLKREARQPVARTSSSTFYVTLIVSVLLVVGSISSFADEQQASSSKPTQHTSESTGVRSTQPTVDRQLDTPNSSPVISWSAPSVQAGQVAPKVSEQSGKAAKVAPATSKPNKPKQITAIQKKAAIASQQNYDKYQLKATNSYSHPLVAANSSTPTSDGSSSSQAGDPSKSHGDSSSSSSPAAPDATASTTSGNQMKFGSSFVHKKAANHNGQQGSGINNNKAKSSSFSLLKKFLPSFMTSAAGPMAVAAAAASAVADKHQMPHSRSSQSALAGDGPLSKASGKIINLLSSKKLAVGDHAPFFIRKPSIDRQASFASGLLSNPALSLGLLFSAPLIPSLLLTPLAIAGLSPAMSAINNFFGDDEEASTPASGPLSVLSGSSSPLSSILQGSGFQASGSSPSSSSFALQAVQSILGPPSTTEKPLFNPGMFASQGIQNAMGSMSSGSSSSQSSGSQSSSSTLSQQSNSPIRNFLGGNGLIQTAASMISPSFAAPPNNNGNTAGSSSASSSSNSDSDDGPGFMQVASDVFEKVANYMGSEKELSQAASSPGGTGSSTSSPLSALVGLSSFNPFQLSSLLASSPFASVAGASNSASSSSGSNGATTQRAGFFSTLKNVYELFSSSFLRRQEIGDSNECQQRLICELHQRAMNSKLFRRSVQSNLMELANLDKSLQDQMKSNPMQARVDADTKAMLNDFLKATNNFKNGRELVNCAKMFPKCSKAMLLSVANGHLTDSANVKAIGRFSNLMKKMKFKSNQLHQNQWKLRKPGKGNVGQVPRALPANQYQGSDYQQVAPLSVVQTGIAPQAGQLTPADSLKLAQQIMMMSQQQQKSQPQSQYAKSPQITVQGSGQQQNQMFSPPQLASSYPNYAQYPSLAQGGQMSNIYTDSLAQVYSSTDSPYYVPSQSAGPVADLAQQSQPVALSTYNQAQQQTVPQPQSYQQYPTPTSMIPDQMSRVTDMKAQVQSSASKQLAA